MLFLNLDKLKIHKGYNYEVKSAFVSSNVLSEPINNIKVAAKNGVNELLSQHQAIDAVYEVVLEDEPNFAAQDRNDEGFLTFVNVFVAEFFNAIVIEDKGRPRERRLDVPENLKVLKMSLSSLKRAINHQTTIDNFNLTIKWNDLYFMLVDAKEEKKDE